MERIFSKLKKMLLQLEERANRGTGGRKSASYPSLPKPKEMLCGEVLSIMPYEGFLCLSTADSSLPDLEKGGVAALEAMDPYPERTGKPSHPAPQCHGGELCKRLRLR